MGDETRALALRRVEEALITRAVSEKKAAQALMALSVPDRALALAASYADAVNRASVKDVDKVAESVGRRFEKVLDETGGAQFETLQAMIREGDTNPVLAMVRGHAGEWSSTAEYLTAELIAELFERDPDMLSRRAERLIALCYTLLCETRPTHRAVNLFFSSDVGQALLGEVADLAYDNDEDAIEILRAAEERGIDVTEIYETDDDSDNDDDDDDEEDDDKEESKQETGNE